MDFIGEVDIVVLSRGSALICPAQCYPFPRVSGRGGASLSPAWRGCYGMDWGPSACRTGMALLWSYDPSLRCGEAHYAQTVEEGIRPIWDFCKQRFAWRLYRSMSFKSRCGGATAQVGCCLHLLCVDFSGSSAWPLQKAGCWTKCWTNCSAERAFSSPNSACQEEAFQPCLLFNLLV